MSGNQSPEPATVVLAVTGGIAAYKAGDLVRRLRDRGLRVRVAMTRSATRFVQPLTFAALSGEPVIDRLFGGPAAEDIPHVRWAEQCDLLCVAPATADFIARLAHGIGDDFASTLALANRAPLLIAPAMEDDMVRHPAVQRNLETLLERGAFVVGPGTGSLASGRTGPGRMAEAEEIAAAAERLVSAPNAGRWLAGQRVVVTAGPTRERIDPIRVFSNRSSGRMGFAVAEEACLLGAKVTLIAGPTCLPDPAGVRVERVECAEEMATAVVDSGREWDIAVLAAAVCDFRPGEVVDHKVKKAGRESWSLELERTRDILAELGARSPRGLLIGFAAETRDLEAQAAGKLAAKGCDLIVANLVGGAANGLESLDNEAIVLDRSGGRVTIPRASKRQVAAKIWEAVRRFKRESGADAH